MTSNENTRMNGSHKPGASQRSNNAAPLQIQVTMTFVILSSAISMLIAAAMGHAARIILIEAPRRALLSTLEELGAKASHDQNGTKQAILPPPILPQGKEPPKTIYTSKNFDTSMTATSSSLLVQREHGADDQCQEGTCRASSTKTTDEEEHFPAGQHLLVDMKNLEASFLNSEERLARAMIEVVNQAKLTLLSYHCHSLVPSGVTCVGVLLESHVSFHTWPEHGVITLDLFTCGSNSLLPVVPVIERLFGVPRSPDEEPISVWSHKLRGYREDEDTNPLAQYDIGRAILGYFTTEYKQEVASVQTKFQRVDIYDVIYNRFNTMEWYSQSLTNDDTYYGRHPELFEPERIILLDGILQSRSSGERAYHEGLVHPAMISHPDPRRVVIVGGGECATLREVLKHNTVEHVKMIEIDEIMVRTSRQFIPSWNDCSDLVGSTEFCGNDPRASIEIMDGVGWFMDSFPGDDEAKQELLDVIIMDALDPQDNVPFAETLYTSEKMAQSIYNSLTDEGVFIVQVGAPPNNLPEMESVNRNRAILAANLQEAGFQSLHMYGEPHSLFSEEWNYMLVMKSIQGRKRFFRNPAEIELDLQRRGLRTKSGRSPFKNFDGTTMSYYQTPSKSFEQAFCLQTPVPEACDERGFNPRIPNTPSWQLEVKQSSLGEGAGRGVFTKEDIPPGSYIALDTSTDPVVLHPTSHEILYDLREEYPQLGDLECVVYYMEGYGFQSRVFGMPHTTVDSGPGTFANHGCNGTYNIGYRSSITEFTADVDVMPSDLDGYSHESIYNPAIDRHLRHTISTIEPTEQVIKAGDELLDNYLFFCSEEEEWEKDVLALRAQCMGQAVGHVKDYEDWERGEEEGEET